MMNLLQRIFYPHSLDVLFYASSWIDELWVRSTIMACCERKLHVALALGSENSLSNEVLELYNRLGVSVAALQGVDDLRRCKARLVVTATSGVLREWFHPTVKQLIHMPHSLSSLHMIYPEDCFDGYSILFAAGPHHVREFKALSAKRGLSGRRVFPVGYGKLDLLRNMASSLPVQGASSGRHVLLAPSWGPGNILHGMGQELVCQLLERGYHVTMRPHPSFYLDKDPVVDLIVNAHAEHPEFTLENPTGLGLAMFTADVLISDYSGSALEFAVLRHNPVVFIDVPKKIVNPNWESLGIVPVELDIRTRLGKVVPSSVYEACDAVSDVIMIDGATEAITDFCYHKQHCGMVAAENILTLLEES